MGWVAVRCGALRCVAVLARRPARLVLTRDELLSDHNVGVVLVGDDHSVESHVAEELVVKKKT